MPPPIPSTNEEPSYIDAWGTPSEVSILLAFAEFDRPSVSLLELATRVHINAPASALRLASAWAAKGILALVRSRDVCESLEWRWTVWAASALLVEGNGCSDGASAGNVDVEGESTSGDPPEALELWASYVFGMLANLGPSPLERIQVCAPRSLAP